MKVRHLVAAAILAAASGGCSYRPSCEVAGPYDRAALDGLECAAAGDNKFALLELGKRYEEGRGVPRDLRRAKQYYRRAATPTSGKTYVYSPAVGKERYGRVMAVDGPFRPAPGLPEARERLERLRAAEEVGEGRDAPGGSAAR